MTDQELISRVCDILKLKLTHNTGWVEANHKPFNPLANTNEAKAFCWDLMVNNHIDLGCRENEYEAMYKCNECSWDGIEGKNPQRAVLLAFVELNKKAS